MKYSRLWVLAAIIAFVILAGFVFSVPHTRDGAKPAKQSVPASTPTVSFRDSFKKGTHTISGSLMASNACSIVTAQATLSDETSTASGILLELSLPEDSGLCLQVPTKESFTTTVVAPAGLPITVTVNGILATTTPS
ncbi:MAG: hypothetical protein PHV99_00655 [Candidatus Pacebacteria bacterium]|nr:hypothetical protein [Candidatus Paceibacterota bacterium]